jgi:YfiH family protein
MPGVVLAVRVADCVPVLLAAPGVVAAVHSGWRSTSVDVVGAAVQRMVAAGADPGDITAWVGPHISQDAYEVGVEVVRGVEASGVPRDVFAKPCGDKWHVDLGSAVAAQLARVGVTRIGRSTRCTTGPDLFSWRGDGPDTGRQAGLIARCV